MAVNLTAADDDDGRRLDRVLRKALRHLPLSAIHRLLRRGLVCVNGEPSSGERRVRAGETIAVAEVEGEQTREQTNEKTEEKKRSENLDILYEGEGLLVLKKPEGVPVHAGGKQPAHSPRQSKKSALHLAGRVHLAGQVASYLAPKLPPSLSFKPGPLHRLDSSTSGVIVFSSNLKGAQLFSAMLQKREVRKLYLALLEGEVKDEETWLGEILRDYDQKKSHVMSKSKNESEKNSEGKIAITKVKVIAKNSFCSLVLAEIETGRSHQIRAQAASRGYPLLGDKKYGAKPLSGNGSFFLHAWRLYFPPNSPLPEMIQAPIPSRFRAKIINLFGQSALDLLKD